MLLFVIQWLFNSVNILRFGDLFAIYLHKTHRC